MVPLISLPPSLSPSSHHCLYSRMAEVEQECVSDINELFLEHPHLFTLSEQDALTTVNSKLKVRWLAVRNEHCIVNYHVHEERFGNIFREP